MPHAEGPHIPGIPQAPWPQGGAASRGPPEPACAANVERSRLISGDPQDGHSALAGSSPARTSTSDFFSAATSHAFYARKGLTCVPYANYAVAVGAGTPGGASFSPMAAPTR